MHTSWRFRRLAHITTDDGESLLCGRRPRPRPLDEGNATCGECVNAMLADIGGAADRHNVMAERLDLIRMLTDPNAEMTLRVTATGDEVDGTRHGALDNEDYVEAGYGLIGVTDSGLLCEHEEHGPPSDLDRPAAAFTDSEGNHLCHFHGLRTPLSIHPVGT